MVNGAFSDGAFARDASLRARRQNTTGVVSGLLFPAAPPALPWRAGHVRASDLTHGGRTLDGLEAARIGLALEAVPDDALDDRPTQFLDHLAGQSATALRAAKAALRAAGGRPYKEALAAVTEVYGQQVLHSADGVEGLTAFLEKRKPCWTHQ